MEKLDFALQVLFVGFFVVMFTLFVLYGILILLNHFFKNKAYSSSDKTINSRSFPEVADKNISKERTAAAIIAAVYSYMQEDNMSEKTGFINVSIEPYGNYRGNSWRMIGRKNILDNRIDLENLRRKKQIENF